MKPCRDGHRELTTLNNCAKVPDSRLASRWAWPKISVKALAQTQNIVDVPYRCNEDEALGRGKTPKFHCTYTEVIYIMHMACSDHHH